MSAEEWLAERARIEQAATEGPWRSSPERDWDGYELYRAPLDGGVFGTGGEVGFTDTYDDGAFIADARTALPKALDALEAVLALHWGEPCAQGPDYCAECEHMWPCETYSAIAEALGVEP